MLEDESNIWTEGFPSQELAYTAERIPNMEKSRIAITSSRIRSEKKPPSLLAMGNPRRA